MYLQMFTKVGLKQNLGLHVAMTNCDSRATSRDWRLMPGVVLAADRVARM